MKSEWECSAIRRRGATKRNPRVGSQRNFTNHSNCNNQQSNNEKESDMSDLPVGDGWGTANDFGKANPNADPADDFSLDAGDVDPTKVGSRLRVDMIGKYHFEIADAKLRPETSSDQGFAVAPHINCSCVVLHTAPGQASAGSYYYHNVDLAAKGGGTPEDWQKRATINFLAGVGLLVKAGDQWIDPETQSTKINVKTLATRLKGMQFIGNIQKNDYDPEKPRYELHFGQGAFRVDDPAVANVPKCLDALRLIGKESAMPGAAAAGGPVAPADAASPGASPAMDAPKKGRKKKEEGQSVTPATTATTTQPAATLPGQKTLPIESPSAAAAPVPGKWDDLGDL